MAGRIRDIDWLSLIKHTLVDECCALTHSHLQVWACLGVEGKQSDCRSHHKNCVYFNHRAGFTYRSEVSGYGERVSMCVRLHKPPTIRAYLAPDERDPLAFEFTRTGVGTLMSYMCVREHVYE